MGTANSDTMSEQTESGDKMLSNLKLYDQITSPIFGPIQILKQTESPFKYIMLYTQNAINDASTLKKMQEKCSWYRSLKPHLHIVGVEGVRLLKKNQMCIQKLLLQIYTKYYNWTISDAINRKLQRNQRFKEGDYIYVLQSMLSIVIFFKQIPHPRVFDRFSIDNVFITPEGQIRMHPFPIQVDTCETPSKKQIKTMKSPPSLLDSEEYVVEMSPKKSETTLSISSPIKKKKSIINQRDDLRDIGVILFSMMLLNNDIEEIEQYSEEKLAQMIQQLRSKAYITDYIEHIMIELLIGCRDLTFQWLAAKLNHIKENDTAFSCNLRLQEGPEFLQPKEIQKNYSFRRLAEHKQLRPGSITILSKQKRVSL